MHPGDGSDEMTTRLKEALGITGTFAPEDDGAFFMCWEDFTRWVRTDAARLQPHSSLIPVSLAHLIPHHSPL